MTGRPARWTAVIGLAAIVSCASPAADASPDPSPSATIAASPSVAEPTAPSGQPGDVSPSPAAGPTEVPMGDIEPGTYDHARFEPHIRLTLGSGWHNLASSERDYERSLFIRRTPEPGGESMMFDVAAANLAPEEGLRRRLEFMTGVEAAALAPVAVGGARGVSVDGRTLQDTIIPSMSEEYFLSPGDRFRLIAVDAAGRTVLIVVEGSEDDWATFLPLAETVLASVVFD